MKKTIQKILKWLDRGVKIKRISILLGIGLIFGFSFFHQLRYSAFDPLLYMWFLLIFLVGIMFLGKEVRR